MDCFLGSSLCWRRLPVKRSKDVKSLQPALQVSNYLGTVHHEYVFTIEEALDALPDACTPEFIRICTIRKPKGP